MDWTGCSSNISFKQEKKETIKREREKERKKEREKEKEKGKTYKSILYFKRERGKGRKGFLFHARKYVQPCNQKTSKEIENE